MNGIEISGDYDGFFHFCMGVGCEVLGKRFLNLRITILDLRLIRLYDFYNVIKEF